MKHLLLLITFVVGISSISKAQSPLKDSLDLSLLDRQNSTQFQSLKGGDRLGVFSKLQNLIRTKESSNGTEASTSTRMGATAANLTAVTALLGEPDVKIQKSIIQYNLKSSSSACKAVIGLDINGDVTFCTIKDCN